MALPAIVAEAAGIETELAAVDAATEVLFGEVTDIDVAWAISRGEAEILEMSRVGDAWYVRYSQSLERLDSLEGHLGEMVRAINDGEYDAIETQEAINDARTILDRVWQNIYRDWSGTRPWLGRVADKVNWFRSGIAMAIDIFYRMQALSNRVIDVIDRRTSNFDQLNWLMSDVRAMEDLPPVDQPAIAQEISVTLNYLSDGFYQIVNDWSETASQLEEAVSSNLYFGRLYDAAFGTLINQCWGLITDIYGAISGLLGQ